MSTYLNNIDVIDIENKKSLELKLEKLCKAYETDELLCEEKIIDLLASELIAHGKDKNQIRQTSLISKLLAQSLGLPQAYCNRLEQAAKIYDIGNIVISSNIYKKEDKLTFEEFEKVRNHTIIGYHILQSQNFPATDLGAVISAEHHEWWDGGGYPSQLKESEINIASSIVAVADSVGALHRKRPGRAVWKYDKILEYIESRAGKQFSPEVVEVFLINQQAIYEILCTDLETVPSSWYN